MQNYRFFFFVIIITIFSVHTICSMELAYPHKKSDITIDMHHFWSNDYKKNISEISNLDLKKNRLDLNKEQFLPVSADTLNHLLYLSIIRRSDDRTLFTEKQQNKFDTALQIKRLVPWGFGVNGVVIAGVSLLPLTNLMSLSQCSNTTVFNCLPLVATIITPTATSIAGAFAMGFVSLYATGLLPDLSSRKANKVQDEIGDLNRRYATIAKYWIDIYFKYPEKAQYIARKIDIEELKLRARSKTYKTKAGGSLVAPLEEAWHFITHNTVLITFTEIENYLYNKIHSRHIDSLNERIESLEKIIQEKDAEIEKLKQEEI